MSNQREESSSPLWERVVAVILASIVIISFIYFVINPPSSSSTVLAIIRFLAAAASGLSAFIIVGSLDLETNLPFNKGTIRSAGGFAVFIAVFLLFFYGIPNGDITITSPTQENTTSPESSNPQESPIAPNSSLPSASDNVQSSVTQSSLMLILDASTSMGEAFGSQSKMEAAKEAVQNIITELPTDREFGLTVYGDQQANSCNSVNTLASLGRTDRNSVLAKLSDVKADGRTAIAKSIQEVARSIKGSSSETTIVLVSDGQETCGGNPCEVVKQLKSDGYNFTFHGVGVDTDAEADKQLSCLAREGGGVYRKVDPDDPSAIAEELERVALGGQFRIKEPSDPQVNGWKIVLRGDSSQDARLLVRNQSDSQLWGTYPLDPGFYDVYLFIRDQQASVLVGQLEINDNQVTEFDTGR